MCNDVRVRRDWIDVCHEYLQADGKWMTSKCGEPGWCRDCNRDGERQPLPFLADAFQPGVDPVQAARIVIAAHLFIPVKLADDDGLIRASEFRRLWIAFHLTILRGLPIEDADVLAAETIGDLIALVMMEEAA